MTHYVALLRGINVGGNNVIKMADLKACFEGMGFVGVRTYIQSGNVVFASPRTDRAWLTKRIEKTLSRTFSCESPVVLRSHQELAAVIAAAPRGFGKVTGYRHYVVFLKEPVTPEEAMEEVKVKEGVDRAAAGPGVLYFSTLLSAASRSALTRVIGTPIYRSMTIRNWNTTAKLADLAAGT